ncbi:PAS domain-containing sensor histidine kinase [Thermosulfurimonas sp. F29]|uniref:hybrid sensor histidine kinase/response regulator n=1 Tax=Thermosulfurimonas sp. F29 TaxID=2867247 RepID=UPI001C837B3B|nr:PAS domain-containing sensor histidine kinase [Thermosulfurimonas sp. F29]MBX6423694.1 PAS domain S-box protein [Thermosulfurimonas sp. F29]
MASDLEFYKAVLDLFPGMVSVVSPEFRVLYANEALKRRCGENPEGKLCYEAFHDLKEPCPWCKKDEVLRTKKIFLREVFSPKDHRWYEIRSAAFKAGKSWGYLSVILDITEKKELEQKLNKQIEFYTRILHENPILILFSREGKISFVNRTFEKITGIKPEEVQGHGIFDTIVPEEDLESWKKHCEEVQRGIFKAGVELPIKTAKGNKRYLLWNCMQVEDPEGGPIIIGMAVDITRQKELFEQYLQAQKMESLGRFTGVLLHELNNLFMALQGYLGVAKLRLSEPEALRGYLEKMEGLIERWRNMSRDLLAFARRSPGGTEILDLAEFLHRQAETLKHLLGSKIQLHLEVPERGLRVRINGVHLQQILLNLAANSREAMPEGGEIRLRLEKVTLSEETVALLGIQAGDYALLTFEDNGPGIAPEIIPHIFEPYFTTKEEGTGLGLATVYSLVKQYQGHVAVYSTPGKGATFKIYLPLTDEDDRKKLEVSGVEILVVEEDPDLLEIIEEMMRSLGYKPYVARSFSEARELLDYGLRPEVLFSDFELKNESTRDFFREMKERFPELRFIIATSYQENVVRKTLSGMKNLYYIHKPFTLEELRNILEKAAPGV